MLNFQKQLSGAALAMLFCFMLLPQCIIAHDYYSCDGGRVGDDKKTWCGQDAWHQDTNSKGEAIPRIAFTVEPWQQCINKTTSEEEKITDSITGLCNKNCLDYPSQSKYYNDPASKTAQTDTNKITLPVVLAWKDVNGFSNNASKYAQCYGPDFSSCWHLEPPGWIIKQGNGYGPISYRIQIQDDSPTGIANLNILPDGARSSIDVNTATRSDYPYLNYFPKSQPDLGLVSSGTEAGVNGKQAFFAVLSKKDLEYGKKFGFNSRLHGGLCFFNATDTYHWRVTACCDADGNMNSCKDYSSNWWTFTVGTAPELIFPYDPDWNGGNAVTRSFKDINPTKDPLNWCPAKLPKNYQSENRPTQYAKSYQITVTSNEKNDFTDKLFDLKKFFSEYLTSFGVPAPATVNQSTHALSVINGSLIYNVYPDPTSGEVEFWYPAQSRGDLAFFSRDRIYSWKLKSCSDDFTKNCFDDTSQEWKINTPPETIPAPQAIAPKNDTTDNEPVGFPISLSWTIPSGANSFHYETNIPNLTSERKTSWNTIPNSEFDDATRKMFGLENVAIARDTTYKWRVKSCAQFDPKALKTDGTEDCDDWSDWFSFRTTGRPPRKDSLRPNLDPKIEITFPQNFTWEKVPGAKSYNIELYAGGNKIASKLVKFGPQDQGQPGTQFDYPDIQPPPSNTDSKAYTWKVQTCADENGKYCGIWESQNFAVKRPRSAQTQNKKEIYGSLNDIKLNWTGQTKNYWVIINYIKPDPQTQADCNLKNPIVSKNISGNSCSMQNDCIDKDLKTSCIGTYQWTAQPCAKPDCSDRGNDNAVSGSFSISSSPDSNKSISVCGQAFDNASSDWDETEVCEIRHLFLFLKIAVNFLLFHVCILLLPIFALISGGWFYLAPGDANVFANIKKMWKAIGIGYAIMLMAWILTSWLLLAFGYNNLWWKIL